MDWGTALTPDKKRVMDWKLKLEKKLEKKSCSNSLISHQGPSQSMQ